MSYATDAEIQHAAGGATRLTELADWNGDGIADIAEIAEAAKKADGWIDGFLRIRFATPIANPSATLKQIAADETVYRLKTAKSTMGLTQADIDSRTDRMRQLELMGKGVIRPDEPLPAQSTAVKSAIVEIS